MSAITICQTFIRVFSYKMAAKINWHCQRLDMEQTYVTAPYI